MSYYTQHLIEFYKKKISVWQKGTISDCMYNIYNGLTIYSEIRKTGHNFVIFNEVANN